MELREYCENGWRGKPPVVMFAGGGTGGHLAPGLAAAEALSELAPGLQCVFLLTGRPGEGIFGRELSAFHVERLRPIQWRGALQKVRFVAGLLPQVERVTGLLGRYRPCVVVALGGCSCVIPAAAARLANVPLVVLESNAIPGKVVKVLAPLADSVCLQWGYAAKRLRARRAHVTGNPVRHSCLAGSRKAALKRFALSPVRRTLLVMGGSQGALPLNRILLAALESPSGGLLRDRGIQILHLTGSGHLPEALAARVPSGLTYRPMPFLECMGDAYAVADLVLARAGGSTLAELTVNGLPGVLVPYPYASDGHQMANACVLVHAGAAVCIQQHQLTPERLAALIARLMADGERLERMSAAARAVARSDAGFRVASEIARLGRLKPRAGTGRRGRAKAFSVLPRAA